MFTAIFLNSYILTWSFPHYFSMAGPHSSFSNFQSAPPVKGTADTGNVSPHIFLFPFFSTQMCLLSNMGRYLTHVIKASTCTCTLARPTLLKALSFDGLGDAHFLVWPQWHQHLYVCVCVSVCGECRVAVCECVLLNRRWLEVSPCTHFNVLHNYSRHGLKIMSWAVSFSFFHANSCTHTRARFIGEI